MIPDSDSDGRRRRQRRKAARPQEIIASALELFVDRGFAGTKLEDVARRAGVSKGTLYLYFESKEALFQAVVQEMVLPELARVEQEVREFDGSAAVLLQRLVNHWWDVVGETRLCGLPKLMIAEAANFPEQARFYVEQVIDRARRLFAAILEKGIRQGEFREMELSVAVRVLMAPLVFAAIWERSLAPFDKECCDVREYLEFHLDTFLRGIAAETPVKRNG